MKVNIFTVADSVSVYEQGKLVIVGTFDNIKAEKCPFVFKPFGVALKLNAERNDYNKSYESRLVLRKIGTSKAIVEITLPLKFPKPPKGKMVAAILAANIAGAKFDSFGGYILELRVGSKVISEIYINVIRTKSVKKKKTVKAKSEEGITMAKKTVNFNKTGVGKLPANKPVMYKIKTPSGKVNYVGVAKRGRVQERLEEHLQGQKDYVPGAKVQIEQFGSIAEARKSEAAAIEKSKPNYNEQGK